MSILSSLHKFEEIDKITPKRSNLRLPKDVEEEGGTGSDWKLLPLKLLLILATVAVVSRVLYLQVVRGEENLALSTGNSIRYSLVRAERGAILDRNGEVIVRNKPSFSVELNTTQCLTKCEKVISEVSKLVTVNSSLVLEKLSKGDPQITLANNLSRDDAIKVEGRLGDLTGVSTQVDPVRDYIYGDAFSHVIGYIGEGGKSEKEGRSGIEQSYDPLLKGTSGSRIIQVNSSGTFYTQIAEKIAVAGENLTLTLDKDLQVASFTALKKAVDNKIPTANKNVTLGGAVVATDPNTGEILALVSYPAFDPNIFTAGLLEKDFQALISDKNKPFFNRSISATYPPGSTFKMVTSIAALNDGVISENTLVECPSYIAIGSFIYRDWYSGGRGAIDVKDALKVSCDTFFYTVGGGYGGQRGVGIERLSQTAKTLGFGKEYGVDIAGETAGLMPDEAWKKEARDEPWYLGDTYITSIGQGNILATPLQVNMAMSYFASRGKIYKPHLVEADQILIDDSANAKNIEVVREGMKRSVEPGGTAYPLFDFETRHKGVFLAGKTGTAEFGNPIEDGDSTHAWFTVFGPYDNPNIVLTVLLEGGGGGSGDAAPVAKEILDEWFKTK